MRIVFFGEDAFSVIVLESIIKSGHEVVAAYCPVYDNNIYIRLQNFCEQNLIQFERISDFSDNNFIEKLKSFRLDVVVVCHFQKILKKELIELPKYGSINLHPSLLPLYRGMAPQHWPIINGDSKTGITVHFIDEGVDTGDLIIQKELSIGQDTYVFDLQNQMKIIYATIVKDALGIIESRKGNYLKQSDLKGSYFGRLRKSNCIITKNMSTKDAYNLIRGVSFPYFGARVENHIVWKAKITDCDKSINFTPVDKKFGIVKSGSDKYILLFDGILKIEKSEIYEK
jgi:methionyl-tRNA formyltransferase